VREPGALAYWLADGAVIPETFPKFRAIKFKPEKLIAACIVSSELVSDAEALDDRLTDIFAAEISFQLDRAILIGAGAGLLLGIVSSPGTVTQTKETGQTSGSILPQKVLNMWSRMAALSRERATWLCNEDALSQIDSGATGGFSGIYIPAGGVGNSPAAQRPARSHCRASSGTRRAGRYLLADLTQYCIVAKLPPNAVSVHVAFLSDRWFSDLSCALTASRSEPVPSLRTMRLRRARRSTKFSTRGSTWRSKIGIAGGYSESCRSRHFDHPILPVAKARGDIDEATPLGFLEMIWAEAHCDDAC
jgi:capsid protein